MNEKRTKKAYEKKTTIWLMKEDTDFIQNVADEYGISQQNAIRMLLYFSRLNKGNLKKDKNIFIIK